jgi:hypothetical protein
MGEGLTERSAECETETGCVSGITSQDGSRTTGKVGEDQG